MDEQEASGIRWEEILVLLLRHWKLILAFGVVGTTIGAISAFFQSPVYEASAKLRVTSERARVMVSPDPSAGTTVERVSDENLNSEVALLKSPALVREVLEPHRAQIEHPPAHIPTVIERVTNVVRYPLNQLRAAYRRLHNMPPYSAFEDNVDTLEDLVQVSVVKNSNLIQISFTGSNPKGVADFVNQLADHHVERHARLNQQSEALSFLETQRQLLSDKLRHAEQALAQFYDRESVTVGSEQLPALQARLAELETALANSNTELAEGTARAQFLSTQLRAVPQGASTDQRSAAPGDPLQLIRNRTLDLRLQRSELLSKYAPTSLKIQEIDRQIAEAQQLLAAEAKGGNAVNPTLGLDLTQTQAQMAAVKARVQSLQEQVARSRATLEHLEQIGAEQDRLEQDVATAKQAFLTYTKKVEEARFSDALDQSRIVNVSIVEPAAVPAAPLPSKRSRTVMMTAIISLAAGVGLAFLLDRINPAVQGSDEAAKLSGLPILAEIAR